MLKYAWSGLLLRVYLRLLVAAWQYIHLLFLVDLTLRFERSRQGYFKWIVYLWWYPFCKRVL